MKVDSDNMWQGFHCFYGGNKHVVVITGPFLLTSCLDFDAKHYRKVFLRQLAKTEHRMVIRLLKT